MTSLLVRALILGNTALWMAQFGREGVLRLDHLYLPLGYTVGYVALFAYLRWRGRGPVAEPILLAAVCALTGIGLAALARIDPAIAARQLRWLYLGLIALAALAHAPVWQWVRAYTYVWAAAGLFLLAWTALWGVEIRGARSWVSLGPFGFQPIEFVKILFLFALSSYLAETRLFLAGGRGRLLGGFSLRYVGPLLAMALLFTAILTLQRDLGAALLLFGLAVAMVTIATASLRYAAAGLGLIAVAAVGAAWAFDHVRTRFLVWLDPWRLAEGRGYQLVESLFALGAGGFVGTGWGQGMAFRIPVVETDFIFSLLVEETGFIGAAGVLFLLAVMSLRILAAAADPRQDDVPRLGAAGIAVLFALQSFLIVGGVTRLLPVTGVTLPLVSYGGSSLVASFIQLGVAYNLFARPAAEGGARRAGRHPGRAPWPGARDPAKVVP